MNNLTVNVFLDKDGWTAYFKEHPNISAGGDNVGDALRNLAIAYELAKECEQCAA